MKIETVDNAIKVAGVGLDSFSAKDPISDGYVASRNQGNFSNLELYGLPLTVLLARTALGAGLGAGSDQLSNYFFPNEARSEREKELGFKRSLLAGAAGGLATGALSGMTLYNQMNRHNASEKQANFARVLKALFNPVKTNIVRTGLGAAAGAYGNNAYLNEVNPDVTTVGRIRSNIQGAVLGGALASRGAIPAILNNPKGSALGAGLLGLRYGVVVPDNKHGPLGFGLGKVLDPGRSVIPKAVAGIKDPDTLKAIIDHLERPVESTAKKLTDVGLNKAIEAGSDEKTKKQIVSTLKDTVLPGVYAAAIEGLGSPVPENPTLADVGLAVAPHATGGVGGGFLGYMTGKGLGNYIFRDNPRADYEVRRRQESRRKWLEFLGGNLGAVGGALGVAHSMPFLNKAISEYVNRVAAKPGDAGAAPATGEAGVAPAASPAPAAGSTTKAGNDLVKQAIISGLLKGLTNFGKSQAKNLLAGSAITGAQYASGLVPAGDYTRSGLIDPKTNEPVPSEPKGPAMDPAYVGSLILLNSLISGKVRKSTLGLGTKPAPGAKVTSPSTWFKTVPNTPGVKSPLFNATAAGVGLAAGPSILNMGRAIPDLYSGSKELIKRVNPAIPEDGSLPEVNKFQKDISDVKGSLSKGFKEGFNENKAKAKDYVKSIAEEAAIPGLSGSGNAEIRKALWSSLLSGAAQGSGIAAGTVAGFTGGDWLADTILDKLEEKEIIRRRPYRNRFIRSLASVLTGGLGAYGALQAMNYGIPRLMQGSASESKPTEGAAGGTKPAEGSAPAKDAIKDVAKKAAARCWTGYEPVPGKTPYSEDSCRPVGSKPKKKEKKAKSDWHEYAEMTKDIDPEFQDSRQEMLDWIKETGGKRRKKAANCGCGSDKKCDNCGNAPCECNSDSDPSLLAKVAAVKLIIKAAGKRGLWDNIHAKRERGEKPAKPGDKDYPDSKSWNATVKAGAVDKLISLLANGRLKQAEGAWTRAEGKSESGGLNAKGRASLKAQGHDIKPPVTEDNPTGERAGRRASFCARMSGMKKKLTSKETASDPDSRINKSLRKWKC